MSNQYFEQTPLFQLNLILWLVWSKTPNSITGIRPIFYEQGFELEAIGQNFSLGIPKRTKIENSMIPIQYESSPDVLLKHDASHLFLPIECKKSSFGVNSTYQRPIKQANCLLSSTGTDIANQIGFVSPSKWSSHVYYAVEDGYQVQIFETLTSLSERLNNISIETAAIGAIGISTIADDGIYLTFINENHKNTRVYQPEYEKVKVKDIVKGESPQILYLIPVEIGSDDFDEYGLQVMEEKIRSALVSLVMRNINEHEFVITEDDIMRESLEVWDHLKERSTRLGIMRKSVRPYIKEILDNLRKEDVDVNLLNREIQFRGIDSTKSAKIQKYFTSKKFKEGQIKLQENMKKNIEQLELPLFPEENDD
ncbi:MAG: hypothetical protein H0X30_24685 [Anaerolineae bacterium]|nr:hypothetical protein [Anaerolineae bacterium]